MSKRPRDSCLAKDFCWLSCKRRWKNGITIIVKNDEAAYYHYISTCGQHGYKRHNFRVLIALNQGDTLLADGDVPNSIVICKFWRQYRLILVDPNGSRHFRLDNDKSWTVVGFERYIKHFILISPIVHGKGKVHCMSMEVEGSV